MENEIKELIAFWQETTIDETRLEYISDTSKTIIRQLKSLLKFKQEKCCEKVIKMKEIRKFFVMENEIKKLIEKYKKQIKEKGRYPDIFDMEEIEKDLEFLLKFKQENCCGKQEKYENKTK